jgi:hypothetical protein
MSPILGIIASSRLTAVANSFESIATVTVGSGGAADVTFSSIGTDWTHLQIRAIGRTDSTSGSSFRLQVGNGSVDTGTNYSVHQLGGDGSAIFSDGSANTSFLEAPQCARSNLTASVFGAAVIDILDYRNTNKNKTMKSIGGWDNNGSGLSLFRSSLWRSTSAINIIKIYPTSGNWVQHTHIALYGIKIA